MIGRGAFGNPWPSAMPRRCWQESLGHLHRRRRAVPGGAAARPPRDPASGRQPQDGDRIPQALWVVHQGPARCECISARGSSRWKPWPRPRKSSHPTSAHRSGGVTRDQLERLLGDVAAGRLDAAAALDRLRHFPTEQLPFAQLAIIIVACGRGILKSSSARGKPSSRSGPSPNDWSRPTADSWELARLRNRPPLSRRDSRAAVESAGRTVYLPSPLRYLRRAPETC